MKITIESTDILTEVHGVRCRVWRGVTERGVACDLAIPMLRVRFPDDARQFEAELKELPEPGSRVMSFRDVW